MRSGRLVVMVVRTLAFVIVRRVLGLVGLGPEPDAKDVEIAVLRHQLMVVRRQVARPRYTPHDRVVLAMLGGLLPRERWRVFLVTPSTLLRWHRELVARRWTYPATGHRRPGLPGEVVELVLRMARENRSWGYVRIVGECSTGASRLRPGRLPPSPPLHGSGCPQASPSHCDGPVEAVFHHLSINQRHVAHSSAAKKADALFRI